MTRILDRLVTATFLKLFALFVFGAPLLFVLGDVTEKLDSYVDRGLSATEVAKAYVFMFPKFMLWSFPIAALIAAVFTVHGMTVNREVVAAKAGGISFHRLVAPLIVTGVFLTGVGVWLSWVVPTTNRIAAEILKERAVRRDWRSDFVYRTEDGRALTIRQLRIADRSIRGVTMTSGKPGGPGPMTYVVASAGRFTPGQGWMLADGYVRQLFPDGTESTSRFQRLVPRGFKENPEDLLEEPGDEELMTYSQIGHLAKVVQRSGGKPSRLLTRKEEKLAIPVATLVIILFGAPLATSSKRGGAAFGIGVSLGSTILYLLVFKLFGAAGESGAIPPFLAAWAANILFLITGVVLMSRVRT